MAVNRAVSSHLDRVGPDPGWRSGLRNHVAGPMVQQRHGGEVHPGRVRPLAGMRGMSQRSFGAVTVLTVQHPSGLGRHGRHPVAADVAERIEDTGPRLLSAPRRIYLGDRPGEPGPHGQNRRLPRFTYSISTWPTNCLARTRSTGCCRGPDVPSCRGWPNSGGISPLNRLLRRNSPVRLPRRPNSGGISPLSWLLSRARMFQVAELPNSGGNLTAQPVAAEEQPCQVAEAAQLRRNPTAQLVVAEAKCSKLPRLPKSGGISPLKSLLSRNSQFRLPRRPNSGGISPLSWLLLRPRCSK